MIFRCEATVEVEVKDEIEAADLKEAIDRFRASRGVEPDSVDGRGWGGFCSHCGKPCYSNPGYSWSLDSKYQWCHVCSKWLRNGKIVIPEDQGGGDMGP